VFGGGGRAEDSSYEDEYIYIIH
jgi:hypothetical protein